MDTAFEKKVAQDGEVFSLGASSIQLLHTPGHTIPLNDLEYQLEQLPKEQDFVVHCAGGYRSMIAASLLKKKGFHNFVDVIGGFAAIKETDLAITDYVCPSTLL